MRGLGQRRFKLLSRLDRACLFHNVYARAPSRCDNSSHEASLTSAFSFLSIFFYSFPSVSKLSLLHHFDTMASSSRRTAMWNVIEAIEPLDGKVVPVRTIQETRPPEGFGMFDCLMLLLLGVTSA